MPPGLSVRPEQLLMRFTRPSNEDSRRVQEFFFSKRFGCTLSVYLVAPILVESWALSCPNKIIPILNLRTRKRIASSGGLCHDLPQSGVLTWQSLTVELHSAQGRTTCIPCRSQSKLWDPPTHQKQPRQPILQCTFVANRSSWNVANCCGTTAVCAEKTWARQCTSALLLNI